MGRTARERNTKIISFTLLFIFAVVTLIPMLWIFISSFKVESEVIQAGGFLFFPKTWTFDNFKEILAFGNKQLPVYGDGMQIRDWLYVEDHCKAIDMVANGGKIGEVYNVGGHNERPNIFIVKTIIEQLHDRLQDEGISEDLIKHVEDRLGHDRRYGIDPTKIREDLGWYPETPFEVGIVKTIDWYLENEEWMNRVTSGAYQSYYAEMYKNRLINSF